MKIKAIASLYKKTKVLMIYRSADGAQWISNGKALYNMSNLPRMSMSDMLTILDIQPDQAPKWDVEDEEMSEDLHELICGDMREDTKICAISVGIEDTRFLLISSSDGVRAIKEEAIKPFASDMENLTFYTKIHNDRTFLEIVDDNGTTVALIAETILPYGDIALTFEQLSKLLYISQRNENQRISAREQGK
jgi:hypothetical protein